MPKIFVTRKIPEAGIDLLKKKKYQVKVSPYDRVLRRKEIIKYAKGVDALLCLLTDKIDGQLLDVLLPDLVEHLVEEPDVAIDFIGVGVGDGVGVGVGLCAM